MTAPIVGTEADRYLQRVRAALADLPDDERNELIEDLSAHLADISAEYPGTLTAAALTDRLGSPEAYAAELRASAGLAPAPDAAGGGNRLRDSTQRVRTTLEAFPAYQRFRAFLPELRPGWWVLRGYLAAVIVTFVFIGGFDGLLPEDEGTALVFVIFAALAAYGSVWLGRRSDGFGRWGRRAVIAGGLFVAVVGLGIVTTSNGAGYDSGYVAYATGPLDSATDLRVYGPDGQLIRDAQVFDQNGNPVVVPQNCAYDARVRTDGGAAENVYPRALTPQQDPYCTEDNAPVAERLPGLVPTAPVPSSESLAPTESPAPTVSSTPSGSAAPSATVTPSGTPTPTPSR